MNKNIPTTVPKEMLTEFNNKKLAVDLATTSQRFDELQEQQKELELLEKFNVEANKEEYIATLAAESKDYLLRARKSKVFLNDSFRGKVPFFARNIILCAAETGSGKSTISSNLTKQAIIQGMKVLVISNEENATDVYNRVTCLIEGISYSNHDKFSDEMIDLFSKRMPMLSKRLTVITDSYMGKTGCTTTIEGVENILNSLSRNKNEFDLIIFDYYQNIDHSVKNPKLADWQVQYRFCKFLDQFKNRSNAIIVVLAQKKPSQKDKELPFGEAIQGRKSILNIATCALNVIKDVDNYCTLFEIKKSRFNDCMGETIRVGFKRGEYVLYDNKFKMEALQMKGDKEQRELMATVKPTNNNNKGE
jgi:KaiC/GvpD/RAD55 family RecA-like ATPase